MKTEETTMSAALVIMAAGLGSRYGGVKQIERVGPGGEILMEYAMFDALRSGFDRIVLVIKPEMYDEVKALIGDRIERATGLRLCYAFQRTEGDWEGLPLPSRKKPLGTVHALLSAREYLDRPFAVINADDYYGRDPFAAIGKELPGLRGYGDTVMASFRLRNTVSPHGTVTRGVCGIRDGCLEKVKETYKIALGPDGIIRDLSDGAEGQVLPPETPVSMNFWGFHPELLEVLNGQFRRFLETLAPGDEKGECLIPVVMDRLISAGTLRCRAIPTEDQWFGLTYPADKPGVMEALRQLHDSGVYPAALWA